MMIKKNGTKPRTKAEADKVLEQIIDYGRANLLVFKANDGTLIVAEKIHNGKLSGRQFNLEKMFLFCANFMQNEESMSRFGPLVSKVDQENQGLHKQMAVIMNKLETHWKEIDALNKRKPRMGWSK